ncbi:MAG: hypothetical protein KA492_12845 [Bacteroidia bacterium]|nr:hypothetical protein [Bacteroidia bacterium]
MRKNTTTKKPINRLRNRNRQRQRSTLQMRTVIVSALFFFVIAGGIFIYSNFGTSEDAKAATTYTWNGSLGSEWGLAGNWTPSGLPGSSDIVIIGSTTNAPALSDVTSIASLTLNNGANLSMNGNSLTLSGNFTMNTGATINLLTGGLTVNGNCTVNGGTISGTGTLTASGTTTVFGSSTGSPLVHVPVVANTNSITFRSTTFNSSVTVSKTGNGNDNSYGVNTFNGNATFTNTGSGNFLFANTTKDIFNADVSFSNTGNGIIYPAYNDVSGTQFNGNIIVSSTNGSGIQFGNGTGSATLAAGKTISIGAGGFTKGTLLLKRFTQTGSESINLSLNSTSALVLGPSTTLGGNVISSSGVLQLNGCTFSGTSELTKTGNSNDQSTGNNTFNGNCILTNSGTGYFLMGNTSADTWNSDATFINSSSSHFYLAYNSGGNRIKGNTIIQNTGTSGTCNFYFCESGASSSIQFDGTVSILNGGTASNGVVRFGNKGNTTFLDNITVSSTLGSNSNYGIHLGISGGSGTCTLTAGKTITIGSSGYTKGALQFYNFTQAGTQDIALDLSGTASLLFGSSSTFGGNISCTSPALTFNGSTFNGSASFTKTGSSNETSNGGNTFQSTLSLQNTGSGNILMGNTNPDIVNGDLSVLNSGSGYVYLAHNSAGNQYKGNTSLINSGSGTDNRIQICESTGSTAVFDGNLEAKNTSTANTAIIRFNLRGTCTFNGNIDLGCTASGSNMTGIFFSYSGYSGTSSQAAGKSISIDSIGFSKGNLHLGYFTQNSNSAVDLNLTGNTTLTFNTGTVFNGNVNCTAGNLYLNSSTFNGTFTGIKTGNSSNTSNGGNTFATTFTLTNSGAGNFLTGNTLPDTFGGDANFTNSGTGYIQLAQNVAGTVFNGNTIFNNTGSGSDARIMVCDGAAAASAVFNGDVTANNTGTANTSLIRFNLRGTCTFNGNIVLNSTAGTGNNSYGIYFGWNTYNGSAILANAKTISIGSTGFTKGVLNFINFTQTGSTAQSLLLTGSSQTVIGPATSFGGALTLSSPGVQLNGATFSGTTNITKTGTSNDDGRGGNTFHGISTIINNGTGYLKLGNNNPDVFNADVQFSTTSTGNFYVADNSAGNQFNGNTTFNNTGTGTDVRMMIAENTNATSTFNGDVTINNSGSIDGFVRFNLRGSSTFNGNILLSSTMGTISNYGICFSWPGYAGTATLASGKTIGISPGSFTAGDLFLANFTQNGTTPQNLRLSGTALLNIYSGTTFNGNLTATSPAMQLNGAIFNGSGTFVKTGATNDSWSGNNKFNSTFTLIDSANATVTLAQSNGDDFNGDATFTNTGTGIIQIAYNDPAGTDFNENIILNNTSTGGLRFGQSNGTARLASGKTISVGASGYTSGDLYFRKFTQSGSGSINLGGTGTAAVYFQTATTFNGTLAIAFPQLYLNGATFNGPSQFEKTGLTDNYSSGGNTFNGPVLIKNSSTAGMYTSNSTADDYNSSATFQQTGTGILNPAYNNNNTFAGDISSIGTNTNLTLGAGGGTVTINGSSAQTITGNTAFAFNIRRFVMNNGVAGLTLNIPVTITSTITLTSGMIYTSATNPLIIDNGITTVSGVSNSSFVNGPVKKVGNQSFTFPVGRNNMYRPIAMTAPASATDQFMAEYQHIDPVSIGNVNSLDPGLNHVSRCEYWTLNRMNGISKVNVTISWSSNSCGVTTIGDLRVARWDVASTKWKDHGNNGTTGNATSGTVLSTTQPTTYGTFTLGSSTNNNPLPVELSEFTAELINSSVVVNWKTMSEINNSYFDVERSNDGQNFTSIARVPGSGNSTEMHTYMFEDFAPLDGLSFYRLRQTDFDGKYEIFDPVSVKSKGSADEFKILNISPNPFSTTIKIDYFSPGQGEMDFQLLDIGGNVVASSHRASDHGVEVETIQNLEGLQTGVYFLKISRDGKDAGTTKMLKN